MAARTTTSTEWADVVEIDRYPIGDLNAAAGRELVDRCRAELAEHGVCNLAGFIAAALGKDVLYRSADPLDALQVTTFDPGEELGWHFDRSEFSVTVMYQQPDAGGEFVYAPGLRSDTDPNYAGVQRVLQGEKAGTRVLPSAPGTLAFFHGHNALHRVTPVEGSRARVNSVLTYGEVPDMRLNDLTSRLFYGRTSR